MASRPPSAGQRAPLRLKAYSPYPFAGMNLLDSAPSIADSEFLWVENFFRLGNGNLRTGYDAGASIYTAPTGLTVIYFDFFNIGSVYYQVIFLSDGSAVQINLSTSAETQIGPAGTFYVGGGTLPATASWGARYLLISNRNTNNDYWVWDGITLFQAGTAQPDSAIITASGSGYTTAPTVTAYGGSGSGIAITATVNAGSVVDLQITNPGTGYQVDDEVQLAFSGGGSDTTATFEAIIDAGGVAAVNVNVAGSGYTSATVAFTGGGGTGAVGTVLIGSGVTSIAVTAGGSGYTSGAAIAFTGGGGTGAAATATVVGGVVTAITVTSSGSGYTSAPTVVITGAGTSAAATASIQNGIITGVTMTAQGTGYTSAPTVAFSGDGSGAGGFAVLNPGGVTGVTVLNPGSNYTSAPGIQFLGGGGTGATGIVQLAGTSIASINVASGGISYQKVPTITITGGGTPTVTATATAVIAQGQVVQINVTNGGSGYTTQPLILILPNDYGTTSQDTGSGASATAVLAPTAIASVLISSAGKDYTDDPAVVINSGSNNAAAGIISLMPYGVSGAAIETYQQRVWLANPAEPEFGVAHPQGGNFSVSAPGSFTDFATSDGGVFFSNSDGFLQTEYVAIRQSNGFLYMFGDGSVSIISNVQTSGNPSTTTFTYQNVDPQTGALFPNSMQDYGKTILFANNVGVYGLYGGSASQASAKLNPLFENASFNAGQSGVVPSSAVATIHGIKHYMLLLTVYDQYQGAYRNVMATWNEKEWTLTSQSVNLTYIGTQKVGSKLFAWGTDGKSIYPLFSQPSTTLAKRLYTKVYGGAGEMFKIKTLDNLVMQAQDQAGSGITCSVDIVSSGMTPQPADPDLAQMYNFIMGDPWIKPPSFPATYPYWPVFATRGEYGIPFFSVNAQLTTKSADFILANLAFVYEEVKEHLG